MLIARIKELIIYINFTLWNSPIFSRTEPVSRIGVFSIFLKELFLVFHSVDDSVLVSIAIFVVCPEDDTFSDSTSLLLLRGDSRLSLHSAYWDWMEKFIVICLSLRNFNRSYENQIDQFHLYFLYKKKNWKSYIAKEFFKIDWFSSYYYDVERWIEIKINLSIKRIFLLKYSAKFYTIAYTNFANDELSYLCIRDIWCSDKSKVTRAINLPAVIQDWYGAHIFGPIVYRAKWSKFFVLLFNRIINCNFF